MITNISIEKLHPHPDNPRKDLGDLTELAESIRAQGVLQNLTVVPRGESADSPVNGHGAAGEPGAGAYTVVIGHRRLEAGKLAGLAEMPCSVTDMDARTQVATMLTENIQRSDLTVYEQAQGFQMMLDLGDTVSDIAKRTGFSDTTVRKRVKLLELDQKTFAQSIERGATLSDYAELEKIKDIKRRNKVLGFIGTKEFGWELNSAITEEKCKEHKPGVMAQVKEFATEMKNSDCYSGKYNYFDRVNFDSDDPKVKKPKDAGKIKYFYYADDRYVTMYMERPNGEKPKKSKEELEREERNARHKELVKQAYGLRLAFARDFKVTNKNRATVDEMAIAALFRGSYVNQDTFRDIYCIETKFRHTWESAEKGGETFDEALARILGAEGSAAKNSLFIGSYLRLERGAESCIGYCGNFDKHDSYDLLYTHMSALGYEMSSEETAIFDGTHEMYVKEELS